MPDLRAPTDEFWQQALDPSVCFLCATRVRPDQKSREHVFPGWMQNAYGLWDQRLQLINGTTIPYRQLTITACAKCNNEVLSDLEKEVGAAFLQGAEAVRAIDEERLFLWLGKFYCGLLFRSLTLALDRRSPGSGPIMEVEELRAYGVQHLLLRRLLGQVEWSDFPASIFIFDALEGPEAERNFDYVDLIDQPFVALRCGSTYVAALLQDFGATQVIADTFPSPAIASRLRLHPLQCTEITSLFTTIVKHHKPAKLLVGRGRQDRAWSVQVLPRGGLSGRPPFEPWDHALQEAMLRVVLERQWDLVLRPSIGNEGTPSFLIDRSGTPFQAPDFLWMPEEVPAEG